MKHIKNEVVYRIDQNDFLIFFNAGWDLFAEENDSSHLIGENICKRSIWGFIHDRETRHLHEALLHKVRSDRTILKLPFRCDSPALRRFMEMDILPLGEGRVEYRCRMIKIEAREPVPVLTGVGGESFLRMCSWCKKVDVGGNSWFEIEDAIKILGLFLKDTLPGISHTMCEECVGGLEDK